MTRKFEHPYAEFLLDVEKPIRYVGGELGSAVPAGGTAVALAFPDAYEIGSCFLGYHILYDVLRREPGIQVERVFAPWPDLEAELRKRSLPLVSLESRRALRDFDIIGFSLQYELTFTNVLSMLDLGGVPIRSEDRTASDPVVLAGGPAALQPEPMAPFVDAFVLGDGEEILPRIARAVGSLKEAGSPRGEILKALAALPGVYVPALVPVEEDPVTGLLVPPSGIRIERVRPVDLSAHPFPTSLPVPDTEVVFDRFSIEIARGCNGGCRFCQGGFVYRPLRLRTLAEIVACARGGLRSCGFDAVSLTSLSTADYPGIERLVQYLAPELEREGVTLSVSSLRAYDLPGELLAALGSFRQATLTFALEAGTQRLRDLINKNVSEEDIWKTAERLFSYGWHRVKLYFMIGLPTETDEDVRSIIDVTRGIYDMARRYGRKTTSGVTVSVSTFVPKPHTPFQWEPMLAEAEIRRRQRMLFELARRHRISLKWHDAAMSIVEGVMARCDRRGAAAVLEAYRRGCRFDGWADMLNFEAWQEAFRATGIEVERYLRGLPPGARLPWDHIGTGVDPAFMLRERDREARGEVTGPCFLGGVCHACGAGCDLAAASRLAGDLPPPAALRPRLEEPVAYRIAFRRFGRLSYMSQLDLVRSFPRLFRRAGVLLGYSQGMRPKPLISFSPALPLGATAIRDVVDVKIADIDLDGQELATRLREVAPEGLEILSARKLGPWEKKLSRRVQAVDSAVALGGRIDREALEAAVESFLDADSVEVTAGTKSEASRRIDIRQWVYEARVADAIDELSEEEGPLLFLRTRPEARLGLIAEQLTGSHVPETRLYRLGVLARGPLGFTPIR